MWLIDQIAEQHILRAIERGELDDLPGAGEPLRLDDDRLIPEHLRAGYRLLKNAGYLPPELETLREIRDAEALLARTEDRDEHDRTARRLRLLQTRLAEARGRGLGFVVERQYREQLLLALGGDPGDSARSSASPPLPRNQLKKKS
jgi:hypothetical protein